jgi:hypothetical protein
MKTINLNSIRDEKGELCAIEAGRSIPFDIKRVYYIFGNTRIQLVLWAK